MAEKVMYQRLKAMGFFEDVGFDGAISAPFIGLRSLMRKGAPIRKSLEEWLSLPGIKKAACGRHSDEELNVTVPLVTDWINRGATEPIPCTIYDSRALQHDFLHFSVSQVVISARVLRVLEQECPNDFEAFPIHFNGVKKIGFYMINAVKRGTVDEVMSGEITGTLIRLQETAVFGMTTTEVVVSEALVQEFLRYGFSGLQLLPLLRPLG